MVSTFCYACEEGQSTWAGSRHNLKVRALDGQRIIQDICCRDCADDQVGGMGFSFVVVLFQLCHYICDFMMMGV